MPSSKQVFEIVLSGINMYPEHGDGFVWALRAGSATAPHFPFLVIPLPDFLLDFSASHYIFISTRWGCGRNVERIDPHGYKCLEKGSWPILPMRIIWDWPNSSFAKFSLTSCIHGCPLSILCPLFPPLNSILSPRRPRISSLGVILISLAFRKGRVQ